MTKKMVTRTINDDNYDDVDDDIHENDDNATFIVI